MTLLLNNEEVERALTPEDAIAATETIYRELAEGKAINRPRSQTYMPVESKENPGFHYRFKSQEGSGVGSGVWALRITSDMAGFSYTAGVKRRRILPVATGNRYCGLVILFDLESIEPIAIMPDGVIQKVRVAALSVVGAKYLAPDKPEGSGAIRKRMAGQRASRISVQPISLRSGQSLQPQSGALPRILPEDDGASWGVRFEAVDSPKKAVEGSDFVQAATAAWDAVFDGHWVEKGMYVASIGGSDASNKRREIDDETIRRADLYVVHSKEVARLDQSPDVWEVAQKGIKTWESIQEVQDLVAGKIAGPHVRIRSRSSITTPARERNSRP